MRARCGRALLPGGPLSAIISPGIAPCNATVGVPRRCAASPATGNAAVPDRARQPRRARFLAARTSRTPPIDRRCSDSAQRRQDPSAMPDPPSAGSRRSRPTIRSSRSAASSPNCASSPRRTARRTPAVLEAVFVVDTHANGLVRNLTAQYVEHASRSAEDRGPALAGAVRAGAGIPGVLRGVRPRNRRSVAAQQVAGAAAGAHRAADRPSAPATRSSGSIAASAGSRRNGASCSRRSRAPARSRIEREPLRLDPMGGPTTIEREFLMTLAAAARRSRQSRRRRRSNGSPRSSTNGASRCA